MPTRLLKLKTTLPHALENRVVNHWGYAVEKRFYLNGNESYIMFRKSYVSDKNASDDGVKRTIRASIEDNVVELKDYGLTKWQRQQLEKRCDNIVAFFPDPYAVPKAVRTRLAIMQQKLLPGEVSYVQSYMDENFPD